ncbi:MAG: hypothetical protein Kow0068_16550 [Marinilabiliales bacterium]
MKRIFTLLIAVLVTATVFAQSPDKMSYQAVVRDTSDNLATDQAIGMQISILQGATDGTAMYVERHFPTTNANGLVTLEIGTGTVISGDFTTIDWANGPYYLKTETDLNGGVNYTITGTNQLLSVPYALYAESSGQWIENVDTMYTDKKVGIGATSPLTNLDGSGVPHFSQLSVENTYAAPLTIRRSGAGSNVSLAFQNNLDSAYIGLNSFGNIAFGYLLDQSVASFQISPNGNVGIGTNNPAYPFQVAGTYGTTNILGSGAMFIEKSTNKLLTLRMTVNTNNSSYSILNFERGDGSGTDAYISTTCDGANGISKIGFAYDGTERIQLRANGDVEVTSGDILLEEIGTGVIMKSPDGQCWRVTVDNSGNFTSTAITCP